MISREKISASHFKAESLQLIEKVRRERKKIIITKRNEPVAQLTPIDETTKAFGKLKGAVHEIGDITKSIY